MTKEFIQKLLDYMQEHNMNCKHCKNSYYVGDQLFCNIWDNRGAPAGDEEYCSKFDKS